MLRPGPGEAGGEDQALPVSPVRATITLARRRGWDVNAILHEAGIPPLLLTEGEGPVTRSQVTSIVRALWRLTDDELMGLGRHRLPRGSFRLFCYAVMGSADLGAALSRAQQFARAVPGLPTLEIEQAGSVARLSMSHRSDADDPEHMTTLVLARVTHQVMAWAIAQPIPLRHVELPFPDPSTDLAGHVLAAPRRYDAPRLALVFDAALLRSPLMRGEADIDGFVAGAPGVLLGGQVRAAGIDDQVRRVVELGLREGRQVTGREIAERLAFSLPTVRRKLADQGTSLRALREQVVRDAAIAALADGEEPLVRIAERLGFSEPSAFTRAFRRWTGQPPSAYRRGEVVIR